MATRNENDAKAFSHGIARSSFLARFEVELGTHAMAAKIVNDAKAFQCSDTCNGSKKCK